MPIRDIMEFDPEATIIIASSVGTQSQLKNALEAGAKEFHSKATGQGTGACCR